MQQGRAILAEKQPGGGGVAFNRAVQRDESILPPLLELRRLGHSAREAIAVVQSGQDDVGGPEALAARGDEHPQHLEKPGRGGG